MTETVNALISRSNKLSKYKSLRKAEIEHVQQKLGVVKGQQHILEDKVRMAEQSVENAMLALRRQDDSNEVNCEHIQLGWLFVSTTRTDLGDLTRQLHATEQERKDLQQQLELLSKQVDRVEKSMQHTRLSRMEAEYKKEAFETEDRFVGMLAGREL